jgi:hypothetical protein
MSGFQITCANKNTEGVIVRIGGPGWSLSMQEFITRMVSETLRLNILLGNEYFDVGLRGEGNDTFLVLEPDGVALSEIEGLQSC